MPTPSRVPVGLPILLTLLTLSPATGQIQGQAEREAAYSAEFHADLTVTDRTATLSLNDPRPLAKAAELLERRFGWRIHYEDAPYAHESDLRDVTAAVARQPLKISNKRVIVPRGGVLEVNFEVVEDAGEPAFAELVLKTILTEHHKRGNPGVFAVRQDGEDFTIVPDRVKDRRAIEQIVTPVLDTPITFSKKERVLAQTWKLIFERVSASTGQRVRLGSAGANFLLLNRANIGADHERARDVIERLLRSYYPGPSGYTPMKSMAWQVYYQPDWGYFFNLHSVAAPGTP